MKAVDASGVVLEEAAVDVAEAGDDVLGFGPHLEQALDAVVGDEAFAEDLGNLSATVSDGLCPSARGGPAR